MPLPAALAPLREREFRLLFAGQAVSLVGDNISPVALAFAILGQGGSASDIGLVYAVGVVTRVALLLVGGVWGDRLSRRRVMLGADAVRAVAMGALAVGVAAGHVPLALFVAMVALHGAGAAFFDPASTALVPETVTPPRLQRGNALLGLARSGGAIAGPALAGIVVAVWGPGAALGVDAGTFVVSAVSLAAMRTAAVARPEARQPFLGELRSGFAEFRARTWVWVIVLQYGLWHLVVLGPFFVLGAVVAQQSLGGAGAWAAILTAAGVGELAGGLLALRLRPAWPIRAITWAALLWVPQVALLAAREPAAVIALAAVPGGAGMAFVGAVWSTALQEHIPPASLARVSAYDWTGSLVFLPLGFALAGPAAAAIGTAAVLWLGVAASLAMSAAVMAVPGVRSLRRVEYGPAP